MKLVDDRLLEIFKERKITTFFDALSYLLDAGYNEMDAVAISIAVFGVSNIDETIIRVIVKRHKKKGKQ